MRRFWTSTMVTVICNLRNNMKLLLSFDCFDSDLPTERGPRELVQTRTRSKYQQAKKRIIGLGSFVDLGSGIDLGSVFGVWSPYCM